MIAAIALGSNLASEWGDPTAAIQQAVHRLSSVGVVTAVSSLRSTEPVGYTAQPRFVNGVALVETEIPPQQLMRDLLEIERSLGRVREGAIAKGPRTIDLDLLLYDAQIVSTTELTVPHPEMHHRAFVLVPLAEVAPRMLHPVLGVEVQELLSQLRDREQRALGARGTT